MFHVFRPALAYAAFKFNSEAAASRLTHTPSPLKPDERLLLAFFEKHPFPPIAKRRTASRHKLEAP
jgi:hypothetical protein